MKRNELFKKTGICITSLALSCMIAVSGASLAVSAADVDEVSNPALGATLEDETAEENLQDEESDNEKNTNSADDSDLANTSEEIAESDDSSSGKSSEEEDGDSEEEEEEEEEENSGGGNTGNESSEEDSESGNTKSSDESDTGSSSSDSGKTNSDDDTSDDDSGSGSSSSKSDDSGSGSSKSDDSGSGSSKSDSSGSGSSKSDSSGSGSSKSDSSGSGSSKSDSSGSGSSESGSSGSTSSKSGSSGSTSSKTDSSDSSDSENDAAENLIDEDGTGGSILEDTSNIPYAGGVSQPTLEVPTTDAFSNISTPLTTTDTELAQAPSAASFTQGADWNTTAAIQGSETLLASDEFPTGYSMASNYTGTNEQLIASQNIISGLSLLNDGFRFYTVDKDLAVASVSQSIYEEMNNTSRQVGQLENNGAMYVLSEENNGWLYVESGNVRGFVPASGVVRGEEVNPLLNNLQNRLDENSIQANTVTGTEAALTFASETIPASENSAFAYRRCTTKSTVIDKQYAVANSDISILEEAADGARPVGSLTSGGLCYVIMQADDHWAYVESGNVRGFTPMTNLTTGSAAKKIVQRNGEATMNKAQQLVVPTDNAALYYTLNSTQEGSSLNNIRTDIIQTAAECIGSPYKWGGNSLKGGCDCSGFVKQLYALYGYNLPRVAEDQSKFGTQIPIADAAPGDLIFFASKGYVYHVAMYAGDGMTIEAFSEDRGIIATSIGNRDAVWATRIIQD